MITKLFKNHWVKLCFSSHIYFSRDLNHPLEKRGEERKQGFYVVEGKNSGTRQGWIRAPLRSSLPAGFHLYNGK